MLNQYCDVPFPPSVVEFAGETTKTKAVRDISTHEYLTYAFSSGKLWNSLWKYNCLFWENWQFSPQPNRKGQRVISFISFLSANDFCHPANMRLNQLSILTGTSTRWASADWILNSPPFSVVRLLPVFSLLRLFNSWEWSIAEVYCSLDPLVLAKHSWQGERVYWSFSFMISKIFAK